MFYVKQNSPLKIFWKICTYTSIILEVNSVNGIPDTLPIFDLGLLSDL